MHATFKIVTLCGSVGALSAYIEFLRIIPVDSGMAFVVLTHRKRDTACLLVEILSQVTPMHVEEIVAGSDLEPNRVYVNPGGQDVTIDGNKFCLAPARTIHGWPDTFDIYLKSVARTICQRAVTVILSGMARDGSAWLEELRQGGGINYAQDDASIPSMPLRAIETGMIDRVGSPAEIAIDILGLPTIDEFLP